MKKILGLAGVAALALSVAGPALAQADVAAMTCGAYFGLDDAGRTEAFNAVSMFVTDAANAAAAGAAAQMSAEQLTGAIDAGCEGKDDSTNLLSVIK